MCWSWTILLGETALIPAGEIAFFVSRLKNGAILDDYAEPTGEANVPEKFSDGRRK